MPIHLPPLSRRQFLWRTVLGSSGLILGTNVLGRDGKTDPDSWALLSDTHIAADPTFVARTVNVTQHLQQVVGEVAALDAHPAAVIVCGDCAYGSGQTGDYQNVTTLLRPLRENGLPIHLALGNHDHRQRFLDAVPLEDPGARQPVRDKYVGLVRSPRLNWFILDSLEKTESTPGLLGTEQLEWLAGSLDAHRDRPAIVMVHHNPGISGNMGLKDTVAFFEVIRPRKQVKAFIFGHTHTWSIEKDTSGLHLVNLPAVAYVFKEGEPSGWVHARLQSDRMLLELRCIDKKHRAHGEQVELPWRDG